jgi:tRNA nucleotidyltransferase (CCA-adding enzyme)
MSSFQRIRESVLEKIRPTQSEIDEGQKVFSKVQTALQQKAEEKGFEVAFIEVEGSAGIKQTQLRDRRELDIFIGLPPSVLFSKRKEPLSKSGMRQFFRTMVKEVALEAVIEVGGLSPSIAYAEHPYVSASLNNFNLDIVFCFDLTPEHLLEKGPITAVDRTPHHSRFVDSHLSSMQRDDVRLLKAFLTSTYVYGDSSPVGRSGFTGFSTEMLIFHTQSLDFTFEFLTQPTLTPLDYFDRPSHKLQELFKKERLIIVDPTDPSRNIASSISERAYRYTAGNSRKFLQNPDPTFFSMQPVPVLTPKETKDFGKHYFVIEFHDETGWHYTKTRDKLYRYFTKLQKFLSFESTGEARFGLVVFEEVYQHPIFAVALYVEKTNIDGRFTRIGPRASFVKGVEAFKKKHADARLKNGQYQTTLPRAFTNIEDALRFHLSEHPLSAKLSLTALSHSGRSTIGKQALWILTQAVQPYEPEMLRTR